MIEWSVSKSLCFTTIIFILAKDTEFQAALDCISMHGSGWLIATLNGIAKDCIPSIYFTSILNLKENMIFGLAETVDGSIQENPNKGSE